MKEALLGKKTISNQRLLAQSDQVLSTFRVNFIEAVKKMEKNVYLYLPAINLNTPIERFYCYVILLY
jgi:hypothetical protein